jgi:hypothetical protein
MPLGGPDKIRKASTMLQFTRRESQIVSFIAQGMSRLQSFSHSVGSQKRNLTRKRSFPDARFASMASNT